MPASGQPAEAFEELPAAAGPDGRAGIDARLVARLIEAQFPQWAGRPIAPVATDGWDNRTYRLGLDLSVRLPTGPGYVPAVQKEHRWLPVLAPQLSMPIPQVRGLGAPGEGYPFPWSVRGWLDGAPARADRITDQPGFAVALAGFLRELQAVDPAGGPVAGEHSFFRGASPEHYDGETRAAVERIQRLNGVARRLGAPGARDAVVWDAVVRDAAVRDAAVRDAAVRDDALAVWHEALAATWTGPPVWFHGDISVGNLLVREGALAAVIDFGTSGVGDPACDLVIAWTFFSGASRRAFRDAVAADTGTWARARGWALWKELIGLAGRLESLAEVSAAEAPIVAGAPSGSESDIAAVRRHYHIIGDLLDDPVG